MKFYAEVREGKWTGRVVGPSGRPAGGCDLLALGDFDSLHEAVLFAEEILSQTSVGGDESEGEGAA